MLKVLRIFFRKFNRNNNRNFWACYEFWCNHKCQISRVFHINFNTTTHNAYLFTPYSCEMELIYFFEVFIEKFVGWNWECRLVWMKLEMIEMSAISNKFVNNNVQFTGSPKKRILVRHILMIENSVSGGNRTDVLTTRERLKVSCSLSNQSVTIFLISDWQNRLCMSRFPQF